MDLKNEGNSIQSKSGERLRDQLPILFLLSLRDQCTEIHKTAHLVSEALVSLWSRHVAEEELFEPLEDSLQFLALFHLLEHLE